MKKKFSNGKIKIEQIENSDGISQLSSGLLLGFWIRYLIKSIRSAIWDAKAKYELEIDETRRGNNWVLAKRLKNTKFRTRPSLKDYYYLYAEKLGDWLKARGRVKEHQEEVDKLD